MGLNKNTLYKGKRLLAELKHRCKAAATYLNFKEPENKDIVEVLESSASNRIEIPLQNTRQQPPPHVQRPRRPENEDAVEVLESSASERIERPFEAIRRPPPHIQRPRRPGIALIRAPSQPGGSKKSGSSNFVPIVNAFLMIGFKF
jgi:hypothetical protein